MGGFYQITTSDSYQGRNRTSPGRVQQREERAQGERIVLSKQLGMAEGFCTHTQVFTEGHHVGDLIWGHYDMTFAEAVEDFNYRIKENCDYPTQAYRQLKRSISPQ
jgi:hypothetical protein